MIITFPRNIRIDLASPPDNFEEIIRQSFHDYTKGTHSDYTYQDKLSYIDRCRSLLHHNGHSPDTHEVVMDLMKNRFEYKVDECGEFPDESDYLSVDFMEECYDKGADDSKCDLYAHYTGDHHVDDRIMSLIVRAIKVVINYEEVTDNE